MPIRDSWRRALVFSGLVDDQPPAHPDYLAPVPDPAALPAALDVQPAPPPQVTPPAWQATAPDAAGDPTSDHGGPEPEMIVVRRIGAPLQAPPPPLPLPPPLPPDQIAEIFGARAAAPGPAASAVTRATQPQPPAPAPPPREVSVLRVAPRSFNDAQLVADRFKALSPVILDMQGVETDLAKRLIGFASGLTYGLDGAMERLNDRVFLLTPRGVEIPAAQRDRLAAQGSLTRS